MSLRKKIIGTLIAGALLSAGAASAENVRTADPPAQSAPAKPAPKRPETQKQVPAGPRASQPKQDARSYQPPAQQRPDAAPRVAPKDPDARAYEPRGRDKTPDPVLDRRIHVPRPPVVVPTDPQANARHHPGYDAKDRHHGNRRWDRDDHRRSCRYDPWWQHRWTHWDTPRFSIFVGWPYWDTWGWEDRHAYRVYERSGSVDTFEVMPPLGYERAVVAYFRGAGDDTIRVELQRESPWGGIELAVLRDADADGDLESAIYTSGRNRDEALVNYQRDGGNRMLRQVAERLYDQIYNDIRDEIRDRD